ncbi:ATP-dependent nuclease [Bacillus toyonensis]|uniref:ATP-dependent nuclease n=1 Tax=Bacillus toyonensis TaxID=155322 RepID=UPI0021D0270B|nr:AAA family ATPase [Bacillus toyonensis]MCU5181212.1 AAA family ATPase [Bacillus toyonensis]
MKIKKIKLNNWMSFDHAGIEIDIDNHFVIIGPNNVGKSNLLRYLLELTELYTGVFINSETDTRWKGLVVTRDKRWQFDANNIVKADMLIEYKSTKKIQYRWISIIHDKNKTDYFMSKSYLKNCSVPKKFQNKNNLITFLFIKRILQSITYLTTDRNPYQMNNKNNSNKFDGNTTFNMLDWLFHNDDYSITQDFLDKFDRWMNILFGEIMQFYSIRDDISKIIVETPSGQHNYELKNMGSGVAQALMLLTLCFYSKVQKKDLIILIEEPETNLHARALANLYRILEGEFSDFQTIITTHSHILLDKNYSKWSIARVMRNKQGISSIQTGITEKDRYEILDDLGVKASHLLLSNLTIWVEGPSDIYYIRNWINKLDYKGVLEEDIHYSFAMYGGSNIKNHSTGLSKLRVDELVKIINFSQYAIVVFDKDNRNDKNKKEGIQRIINEADQNENIMLWETDGKEIENYVPKALMLKVLKLKGIKSENHSKVSVAPLKNIQGKFKNDIGFQVYYSDMYKLDKKDLNKVISKRVNCKNCSLYTDYGCAKCKDRRKKESGNLRKEIINKIQDKMVQKKVEISKNVGKRWNSSHSSKKLVAKLQEVVDFIKKANCN